MTTARATVVDAEPVSVAEAERWLAAAGIEDAEGALAQVARAVRAHRLASGDPAVHEPALAQALVVRAGHGAGEQVAEGRWRAARELPPARAGRRRRVAGLQPQERLAALLGGHAHPLACEELALRARHDLDSGQLREAALQLRAALEAALRELPSAPDASADMARRVAELRELRPAVVALADDALGGVMPPEAERDARGHAPAAGIGAASADREHKLNLRSSLRPPDQLPLKSGARFSRKAAMPSLASAEANTCERHLLGGDPLVEVRVSGDSLDLLDRERRLRRQLLGQRERRANSSPSGHDAIREPERRSLLARGSGPPGG